jgi:carbon monoxide dehydrogenase subunit G
MELKGERTIPASRERTWAALNDPQVLKACIAGCESLEPAGADAYLAQLAVKIGPVSARFKGSLKLVDVRPPEAYTIHFDGQGGVAGFGKGSADVALEPAGEEATLLRYLAKAQVGGRIAQVGSRLVDAAAAKIADDFFAAFESHLRVETEAARAAAGGEAAAEVAPGAGPAVPPAGLPVPLPAGSSNRWLWWVVALVALALLYALIRR